MSVTLTLICIRCKWSYPKETKPPVAIIQTLSLNFTCHILTPKSVYRSAKSHYRNEGSIINLVVMIVAFEFGNGEKFNIKV